MKTKYNILFYPKPPKGYLRVQIRTRLWKFDKNLGYRIDAAKWSRDTQLCVRNTTHFGIFAAEINERINEISTTVNNYFSDGGNNAKELQTLINIELGRETPRSDTDIQQLVDMYVREVSQLHTWADSTFKKWRTIKKRILEAGIVSMQEINDETLSNYVRALILQQKNNTTINRELSYIFTFLRWCAKKGFYDGNIYNNFDARMKTADTEIVYLSWDELQNLYSFDFGTNISLAQVRDVFCFQCFTSLRYSDVKKLRKTDIVDGVIHVVMQKTSELVKIELNDYSRTILERYRDFPTDYALPCISNQKMNDALKKIGELAGIDGAVKRVWFVGGERREKVYKKYELLTTHAGRRTFVVNALYLGIPERVVRSWTGHADSRAMNPYVAIVEELKQNEMSKFNK